MIDYKAEAMKAGYRVVAQNLGNPKPIAFAYMTPMNLPSEIVFSWEADAWLGAYKHMNRAVAAGSIVEKMENSRIRSEEEIRTIRADIAVPMMTREPALGSDNQIAIALQDQATGGQVHVYVPQAAIPLFMAAALKIPTMLADLAGRSPGAPGPGIQAATTAVAPTGMHLMDPAGSNAPAGHTMVRFEFDGVPFDVTAPTEVWRTLLAALPGEAPTTVQ